MSEKDNTTEMLKEELGVLRTCTDSLRYLKPDQLRRVMRYLNDWTDSLQEPPQ